MADGAQLFRCDHVLRFPLGGELSSVSLATGAPTLMLPNGLASAIGSLTEPCTLDDHVERIRSRAPAGIDASLVRAFVDQLVGGGWLFDCDRVLDAARRSATSEASARIETVVIPTKNRTRSMLRCLQSQVRLHRRYGHDVEYIVGDDSDEPRAREHRSLLAKVARRQGIRLRYAGPDQKRRYARLLAERAGVDPRVIQFLLLGDRTVEFRLGANRNALLLDALDRPFLTVDDDVMARACLCPGADLRVLRLSDAMPECWFFADRHQALRSVPRVELDLLGACSAVLGSSVATCVAQATSIDVEHLSSRVWSSLRSGGGRVGLVQLGTLGDSALSGPEDFLFLPWLTRRRLLNDPEQYRCAMTSRELLRASPAVALSSPFPLLLGACFAVDGRMPLPPFPPVSVNEDSAFGACFASHMRDVHAAALPIALLHDAGRRSYPETLGAWDPKLGAVFVALIEHAAPNAAGDPIWRDVGRTIASIAQSADDLQSFVLRTFTASERIARRSLEQALDEHAAHAPHWAADARRVVAAIDARSRCPGPKPPCDVLAADSAERWNETRRLVELYGLALQSFAELGAAARELHAEDIRVSEAVIE